MVAESESEICSGRKKGVRIKILFESIDGRHVELQASS